MKNLAIGLIIAGVLALTGCAAPAYDISVNGYTDLTAPTWIPVGSSFFVIENQKAKNPLLEKEVKDKINRLLEKHGYRVATFEKAEYYLFFNFGIGQERTTTVAMPDYYPFGMAFGGGGPYRSYFFVSPFTGYYPYTETIYDRWLLINVVDGKFYREKGQWRTIWAGEARSRGTSADLRTVINYLLLADFKEFGKNTGKAISVEIDAQAPTVYGLTPPPPAASEPKKNP
jgi:hypothetical protein